MDYSDNFSDMQRDALERLRRMQERSKNVIEMQQPPPEDVPPIPPIQPIQPMLPDPFVNLLSGIGISSDKLLIIVMLILLYKNKADVKLLLALGYLLL